MIKSLFDLHSVPYNVHNGMLYTPSGELEYDVNIVSGDKLDFKIPFAEIPTKFYTVEYDANGGDGDMNKSVHEIGLSNALLPNEFTKTGYHFVGWTTSAVGEIAVYTDGQKVNNIANAGETVKLYAKWSLDEFSIKWNTVSNCSIMVARKDSPIVDAKIGTLNNGDIIYYNDKLEIKYTANTGYHFEENGISTSITKTITVTKDITSNDITANPIINTYTVVYNGNGSTSGSMSSVIHTYGVARYISTNSYKRHGWEFTGWKDQNGRTYTKEQQVNNLTSKHGDTITLYAQWKILTDKVYSLGGNSFDIGVTNESFGYADKLGNYFNINDLLKKDILR